MSTSLLYHGLGLRGCRYVQLELDFDAEKLFRLPGGSLFVLAEGSWSEGIDVSSIGSLLGVNDNAGVTAPLT